MGPYNIQPVDVGGLLAIYQNSQDRRTRQIAMQREMEREDRKLDRETRFEGAYNRFIDAGGLGNSGRTSGRLIEQGAGPVPSSGLASAFPGAAIGRGMKGVLQSSEWNGSSDSPPPISAAPSPPADWKERIGPEGMAALPSRRAQSPIRAVDPNAVDPYASEGVGAESGVTGQEAPTGRPENTLPPEISRMANSPNMDDRNAAFIEMARIDPKLAYQIQSDARDAALDRIKGADEGLRLAAGRLAHTRDEETYQAVLADLDSSLQPLGIDLRKSVPANHPGAEGIKQLQLQALDMAQQFAALDREHRTDAMIANYEEDNARADREADDRATDRRERRGLAERRESRISAGRGGGSTSKKAGGPTVLKNGTIIQGKGAQAGKRFVYHNGELKPLRVSQ